ncbi:hypothetical protein B9Z55_000758 [Caenorhabditis nigoni]|nr:hypothetical protein B9Z55_000758 [Caenorhabditis nigoni]
MSPPNVVWKKIMDLKNYRKDRNGIFSLNVSGKMIDFQMCKGRKKAMVCFEERDKESVIESILNHCLDFFGSSVPFYWRFDYLKDYFVPKLNTVSLCIDICLEKDFSDWEKLETFISSSPVFKWIGLETKAAAQSFHPESKFHQVESIRIVQLENTFPFSAMLRHFKGRQATVICNRRINSEDLIEFVNRWKSGEAFQRLEYLTLDLHDYGDRIPIGVPQNQILDEIGVKYIDAKKQPPTHTVPKLYDWNYRKIQLNTYPIMSRAYVVRQLDNRVASISIGESAFRFGVWDKTEEEFLELISQHP